MLKAVRPGEELNEKSLLEFLYQNELISNSNTSIDIKQFSNGYSNLTYLLSVEDKEYVLRKPPKGAIKRGHDMSREYKVLSSLNSTFSKAPKTFAYADHHEEIGSSFYIMEKVNGTILTFKEAKTKGVSPTEFKTIANSWLETFIELHQLDYKSVGLEDLGKPVGYVERQVTNWSKQYRKAATKDIADADFVMQWMAENLPADSDAALIHNDFKYDNIVFEDGNWSKVNAILDWEMCTLGDPLMDLGTSIAYWTMPTDGPALSLGIPSPTVLEGNPSRTEIVNAYSNLSGKNIHDVCFYYVYGLFKIAVIVQQIFYRYDKGLTSNEKFANLDQVCEFLCLMAKQSIQKKRIDNLF